MRWAWPLQASAPPQILHQGKARAETRRSPWDVPLRYTRLKDEDPREQTGEQQLYAPVFAYHFPPSTCARILATISVTAVGPPLNAGSVADAIMSAVRGPVLPNRGASRPESGATTVPLADISIFPCERPTT